MTKLTNFEYREAQKLEKINGKNDLFKLNGPHPSWTSSLIYRRDIFEPVPNSLVCSWLDRSNVKLSIWVKGWDIKRFHTDKTDKHQTFPPVIHSLILIKESFQLNVNEAYLILLSLIRMRCNSILHNFFLESSSVLQVMPSSAN